MIMEFIKNAKGNWKLLHEGFAYVLDKRREDRLCLRCEKHIECSGRLITEDYVLQSEGGRHTHAPDPARRLFYELYVRFSIEPPIPKNKLAA